MNRDFSQPVLDLDGESVPDVFIVVDEGTERPPLTMGRAASVALASPNEQQAQARTLECIDLALRLRKGGVHDVTVEELKLIKDKAHDAYRKPFAGAPIIEARLVRFLDRDQET